MYRSIGGREYYDLTFAPATQEDIRRFYGSVRESLRAICIKRDGEPVGIIGIAYERWQARFFFEHKDMTHEQMRRMWRAVKAAMKFVHESKRPVVAIAENDHGHKNLTRLGFVRVTEDLYQWPF